MKKVLYIFIILLFSFTQSFGQTNAYTRADSIHLTNTAKNTIVLVDGNLRVLKFGSAISGLKTGDSLSTIDRHLSVFRKVSTNTYQTRFGVSVFGGLFMSSILNGDTVNAKGIRYLNVNSYPESFEDGGLTGHPLASIETCTGCTFDPATRTFVVTGGGASSNADSLGHHPPSYYLNRANHTGSQAESTVTNLVTDLATKAPTARTLTINGTTLDLSANRSWTVGDALAANPLSQFASTTSAQLRGVLSDETGTGVAVFATAPTITLPNATGLPLTTGVTGLLPVANGGTGTATPAIVAGTNVTVSGTWPNQTINSTGGGGGGTVDTVSTISAMQSYSGTLQWVLCKDPARGGTFYYSPATNTADNGVVFAATGKGSGYWIRQYGSEVYPEWWGTGTTTSRAFIQAALNYAAGRGVKVLLRNPRYNSDSTLLISSNTEFELSKKTILSLNDAADVIFILNKNASFAGSASTALDSNIYIHGGIIRGGAQTLLGTGALDSVLNSTISMSNIHNLHIYDLKIDTSSTYGIFIASYDRIYIHDVNVLNGNTSYGTNDDCIHLAGPGTNAYIDNTKLRATDDVIAVLAHEAPFRYKLNAGGDISDTHIDHTIFNSSGRGIRFLASTKSILNSTVSNTTGTVKNNILELGDYTTGFGSGGITDNFIMSNTAVTVAQAGTNHSVPVIFLSMGTYGSVSIDNTEIKGTQFNNPTIKIGDGSNTTTVSNLSISNYAKSNTDTISYADLFATHATVKSFKINNYNVYGLNKKASGQTFSLAGVAGNNLSITNASVDTTQYPINLQSNTFKRVSLTNNYNASSSGVLMTNNTIDTLSISGTYFTDSGNLAFNKTSGTTSLLSVPLKLSQSNSNVTSVPGILYKSAGTIYNIKAGGVSGTVNQIAKFVGTGAVGNSQIFDDGTSVIVGGSTPAGFNFDVLEKTRIGGALTATGGTMTGVTNSPSISAAANGDRLIGVDLNPAFTVGAFTDVTTLGVRSQKNFGVGILSAVSGTPTGTPSITGGALSAATYYYKVVALDLVSTPTTGSSERSATVASGTTGSVVLSWTAVTGASGYRVYRGTSTGAQNVYYTTSTNSFTDVGGANTSGTIPTVNATAVGYFGVDGTINGLTAGFGQTQNTSNAYFGFQAGLSNTSNTGNAFFGGLAGGSSGAGLQNTYLGYKAGQNANSSTGSNSFGGWQTGISNTGNNNSFWGIQSGNLGSGSFNSILGAFTAQNMTTGHDLIILGYQTGYYNTTGSKSIFIGNRAGTFITGGSTHATVIDNSVIIGDNAYPLGDSQTNQIVIGYQAVGNGSNTATIGNSSITNNYFSGTLNVAGLTASKVVFTDASKNLTSTGIGTSLQYIAGDGSLATIGSRPHTIFTPTTGGTVALTNNQYNIINPAGALLALTVNLPSSPVNNDCVFIKFTQNVTTVTYGNGTVVDGITAPTAGGLTVLVYDSGTTSWY